MARFENIGDNFDKFNGKSTDTYYVDVKMFAEMLYQHMNGVDAPLNIINIVETSLSGNQAYSKMQNSKTNWRGDDDDKIKPPTLPSDKPNFVIALPKQRIRSFYIEYVPLE